MTEQCSRRNNASCVYYCDEVRSSNVQIEFFNSATLSAHLLPKNSQAVSNPYSLATALGPLQQVSRHIVGVPPRLRIERIETASRTQPSISAVPHAFTPRCAPHISRNMTHVSFIPPLFPRAPWVMVRVQLRFHPTRHSSHMVHTLMTVTPPPNILTAIYPLTNVYSLLIVLLRVHRF